jgi:hypothetical protein
MAFRNERQAYWDDIDRNIANVDPLSGSGALLQRFPAAGRGLHSLTSKLNLRTFGTHRSRYSST